MRRPTVEDMTRDEKQAYFLAFTQALAVQSAAPWEPVPEDGTRWSREWRAVRRDTDACVDLSFYLDHAKLEHRVELTTTVLDADAAQYKPYDYASPKITVAVARGAQVAAQEAVKRLLPDYLAMLARVQERQRVGFERLAWRHATAAQVAEVLGAKPPRPPARAHDSTDRVFSVDKELPHGTITVTFQGDRADVKATLRTTDPLAFLPALQALFGKKD